MIRTFLLLLSEMRVKQWTKNFLVYAAPAFNGTLFNPLDFLLTCEAFFAFCMAGSGIYIINDIYDLDKDRLNPDKRSRPLAAGTLNILPAVICSFVCITVALTAAFMLNMRCFCIILSYLLLNLLYTVKLKHVVIIDVMIIAYGFVARAVCGAAASGVNMTAWFLLCIMFLSLLLALGKRRYELVKLHDRKIPEGREVLKYYSLAMIDHMMSTAASGLIMSYSLFTMDSQTRNNNAMALTIPLIVYCMFYYLYIVHVKNEGGSPDETLYKEKNILITVVIYAVYIIWIRNFNSI